MTRTAFAFVLATLLPMLAAASAGPGPIESLDAFARAVAMKKGLWKTRITIVEAEFKPSPTAAPEDLLKIRADMKARVGKINEREECLDPGSADPLRLPGIVIQTSCAFSSMKAADGRWTLDSACDDPARRESATMKGEGTYSRRAVAGRQEGEASFKGVVMHLKAEFESRHVGKCAVDRRSGEGWDPRG